MVGPVLHHEMMLGSRRSRAYYFRWIYAGWLVLQVLWFLMQFEMSLLVGATNSYATPVVASWFVETFVVQQLILLVLATPVLTAGAVTDEKTRGTLQYLLATASKAGASAAAVCCLILAGQRYAEKFHTSGLAFIGLVALAFFTPIYGPDMSSWLHHALRDRFPIWADSIRLLALHPFTGTGLGTFAVYYATVRTEYVSGGWFAHNDLLQLAIETGIPAAAAFCILWLTVLLTTCRRNFAAAVTMLAVLLQSMVEFQFYLPSVSLLMGVALAYHRLNNKPSFQGRPSHVA
jgi:O-antigen ligase